MYLHIIGISRNWWNNLQNTRLLTYPNLKWKYHEMSEIAHIPIDNNLEH